MTTDLREELAALAETQPFSPDPTAWDRGRRARSRTRVVRAGAALAVVALVVGVGAIAVRPDREAPQPADVPGGALPSRIPLTEPDVLTDLAIGSASVAYVDTDGTPVLVDASTGTAHRVVLPDFPTQQAFRRSADYRRGAWLALSADGRRLAYPTTAVEGDGSDSYFITSWYRVVDLSTGASELVDTPPYGSTPMDMSWTADGQIAVVAFDKGRIDKPVPDVIRWVIDPGTGDNSRSLLTGIVAPSGGISAVLPEDQELVDAVMFETASGSDSVSELPADRYPEGAVVQPIGWVEPDVLVASIDPPQSDVVEHPRLVLVSSPEQPESSSSFREFLPRLPPSISLSIAVDLIPDLTGDPDQELTHDFTADPADETGWLPLVYGAAGVLAVLSGLVLLAALGRRRA